MLIEPLLVRVFRLTLVEAQLDVSRINDPLTVRLSPLAEKLPVASTTSLSTTLVPPTENSLRNTGEVVTSPNASTIRTWKSISTVFVVRLVTRSEERRVGKECRSRRCVDH